MWSVGRIKLQANTVMFIMCDAAIEGDTNPAILCFDDEFKVAQLASFYARWWDEHDEGTVQTDVGGFTIKPGSVFEMELNHDIKRQTCILPIFH